MIIWYKRPKSTVTINYLKATSINAKTTVMRCFVKGCNCNTWNKKDGVGSIKMFSFPKDKTIRKKWYKACGVPHNCKNVSSPRVCAIHFDESAYTLKSRLGFAASRGVRHLIPDAIPTLNLPVIRKDKNMSELFNFNSHVSISFLNDHDYRKDNTNDTAKIIGTYKNEKIKLLHENKVLHDINATLEDRVKILEDKLNKSIQDKKDTEILLLNRIRSLQEQLRNVLADSEECVKEEIQELFTEMFAPKKIRKITLKWKN